MKGKGLTPAQLRINWFTPSTQHLEQTGPYESIPACIAAINVNSAYTPEVSYYKAFRALQAYGAYSVQMVSKEADENGTYNVIVVVISATEGQEVVPGIARAQEPILPQSAPLFEPQTLPELAILARSINEAKKGPKTLVKRKPVQEPTTTEKVAPRGQKEGILAPVQEFTDEMQDQIDNDNIARAQNGAFLAPQKRAKKAAKDVAKVQAEKEPKEGFLAIYRIEYYTFDQSGQKGPKTLVSYVQAGSKKLARDVARERANGARIQVIHVEHAPSRKLASKKFLV